MSHPVVSRVALLLLLMSGSFCFGQSTYATITGTVTDPNGAVVPGATVEAIHTQTNYRYSAKSNEAGQYTIANLREGEYTVMAGGAGFTEFKATGIQLAGRDIRRIDARLQLSTVRTTVEVKEGATLIETETARISDSKNADLMHAMPLVDRSVWSYMQLTPTVAKSPSGYSLRFAGSRPGQGEVAIDGITIADSGGTSVIGPLIDWTESVQEIRVESANNSAEFGPIGTITVLSRSGTNTLHGSAFDYYQSPMMLARDPFATQRGGKTSNRLGASLGGPVYLPRLYDGHNKTFFLFSLERMQPTMNNQNFTPTVPLASWRKGDFSSLLPGTVVKDPFNGNTPFPNNTIPSERINPVSAKLMDLFYPLPNYGDTNTFASQNYRQLRQRNIGPENNIVSRIDHRFNDKAWIYGRYTVDFFPSVPWDGTLPTLGQRDARRFMQNSTISYTHTLRSNLLSEFRWGLSYNHLPIQGPVDGYELAQQLGLQGLAPDLPHVRGITRLSFSGLGLTGLSTSDSCLTCNKQLTNLFQEHISWFRGRHSVKGGFILNRTQVQNQQMPGALFGSLSFSNRFTGFTFSDYLLGIPTSVSRGFAPPLQNVTRWGYNFFITDDFKITPKLTLNLGLRYELQPGWTEAGNLLSGFNVADGRIVVPDSALNKVSPLIPAGYVGVETASQAGWNSRTLLHADRNNFAPRIGVAYRPWDNNTVFRGGFGIYYDIAPYQPTTTGTPFVINEPGYTNPLDHPDVILPRVFPAASVGRPASISLPGAINPNLRIPYSMQYNFTIERQQWDTGFRASYIGTNTRQGIWYQNITQPVADGRPFIEKPRLFPQYPGVSTVNNGANHNYNALVLEAERHMKSGLHFQSSWTWARDIGDLGYGLENAYDRARERGVNEDPPTHKWTSNMVYELPFGKGRRYLSQRNRLVNALVGGWQVSAIYVLSSGMFLTPSWSGPDPTGTAFTNSSTPAYVTIRPDQIGNPNLSNPTLGRWFDPGAFAAPAKGRFGSSARGVIVSPGVSVMHAGLFKTFIIRERARLRWEFTATNALNHPNWGYPGTNITSTAQAGVITSTNGNASYDAPNARQGSMSLRLEW